MSDQITHVTDESFEPEVLKSDVPVLVDAGIVMTENVIRHCEKAEDALGRRLTAPEVFKETLAAATQVGRPMFFSMMIIILAFVPVFLLTGQEGKLFHPLAYTKSFALLGAVLLAITAVPVFCTLLVRGPFKPESENWLMKFLLRLYDPVLDWALHWRKTVLGCAAARLRGVPRRPRGRTPGSPRRDGVWPDPGRRPPRDRSRPSRHAPAPRRARC